MDCGGPGSFCRGFKAPISESFATPRFLDDEDRSSRNSERTAAGKDSLRSAGRRQRHPDWVSRSDSAEGSSRLSDPCRRGLLPAPRRTSSSSSGSGIDCRPLPRASRGKQKVSQSQKRDRAPRRSQPSPPAARPRSQDRRARSPRSGPPIPVAWIVSSLPVASAPYIPTVRARGCSSSALAKQLLGEHQGPARIADQHRVGGDRGCRAESLGHGGGPSCDTLRPVSLSYSP